MPFPGQRKRPAIGLRRGRLERNNSLPCIDDTVDIVFNQTIRSVESQHAHASSIDSKASFVLSAATLVVGFQGILRTVASHNSIDSVLIVPALGVYAFLIVAVFQSYRTREFLDSTMQPREMTAYYRKTPQFTKRQFIASLAHIHSNNENVLNDKLIWLRRAEVTLLLLVAVIGLAALVESQRFTLFEWVKNLIDNALRYFV